MQLPGCWQVISAKKGNPGSNLSEGLATSMLLTNQLKSNFDQIYENTVTVTIITAVLVYIL